MRTIHTLATSAVAMLGLVTFGTNLAQAGHPIGNGKDMGHGPVIKNKGTLGKDMGHGPVINTRGKDSKWDKDRYKDWNRYSYRYGYQSYCFTTEECQQPVYEVPVCEEPVVVPTACYEPVCGYETYPSYEYRKTCYDGCYPRHRERPLDDSKPTTASSHRNTENLGSVGSHSMASHTSSGRGRK
jgi:hypothetical protein